MMLVWARALVFAHLNGMELIVSPWGQLKIGPMLRREKHSRIYFGYFKNGDNMNFVRRQMILRSHSWVVEPEIEPIPASQNGSQRKLFVFSQIPHWADYFKGIKEHRELILESLYSMLRERHCEELEELDAPVIGVHVRMGDFRKLLPGEDFAKVGHVRTPFSYFTSAVEQLRALSGKHLPVTIFSDGYDEELRELLSLPFVTRSRATSDVVDMLLLSKARVIIPSPGSTFGYWSAFLSEAAVLHHPNHFHAPIRSEDFNRTFYEGAVNGEVDAWPSLLRENIRSLI